MLPRVLIRPPALQQGDCIGLAAPASPIKREALNTGIDVLHSLGFRTYYTPRVFETYRYLAGSDEARAQELVDLFCNPDIKAIFCCRGGYGSQRLIPYLDPAVIKGNPKIFLGYSDLTSLLLYFYSCCGLVTFHGPVVAGDLNPDIDAVVKHQFMGVLTGQMQAMQPPPYASEALTVVRPGEAEGRLIGGCLSLFVCTIGTPYQPETRDTILFLEDRGERLYAIDRMLTYLKRCGMFDGVRGLIIGEIEPMPIDRDASYGMVDIIRDVLGDLDMPILYGFPAGHHARALTLPFGVQAAIRANRLVLCDSPVTPSNA